MNSLNFVTYTTTYLSPFTYRQKLFEHKPKCEKQSAWNIISNNYSKSVVLPNGWTTGFWLMKFSSFLSILNAAWARCAQVWMCSSYFSFLLFEVLMESCRLLNHLWYLRRATHLLFWFDIYFWVSCINKVITYII